MPFFFLIAGAGSWFALRRRTAGQFTRDAPCACSSPSSPGRSCSGRSNSISPGATASRPVCSLAPSRVRGRSFSLSAPSCSARSVTTCGFWVFYSHSRCSRCRSSSGSRERRANISSRVAGVCERRGGIVIFILPLVALRLTLHPLFPVEHDWADFFSSASFSSWAICCSQMNGSPRHPRDWPLLLGLAS